MNLGELTSLLQVLQPNELLRALREVEEMMLARGVTVSHETIRQWTGKFGQAYANGLRRLRAQPGDKWHLDDPVR